MKKLSEKVSELMEFIGTDCYEDKQAITRALKEQDRDTRHACAEAVIQCGTLCSAHDACMNTRAV